MGILLSFHNFCFFQVHFGLFVAVCFCLGVKCFHIRNSSHMSSGSLFSDINYINNWIVIFPPLGLDSISLGQCLLTLHLLWRFLKLPMFILFVLCYTFNYGFVSLQMFIIAWLDLDERKSRRLCYFCHHYLSVSFLCSGPFIPDGLSWQCSNQLLQYKGLHLPQPQTTFPFTCFLDHHCPILSEALFRQCFLWWSDEQSAHARQCFTRLHQIEYLDTGYTPDRDQSYV